MMKFTRVGRFAGCSMVASLLAASAALVGAQTAPTMPPGGGFPGGGMMGGGGRPPATRAADASVTPAVKDANRHRDFLYRITEGPVGLLFLGDSITDFWPTRGQWSWLKFAKYQPANFGVSGDKTEHLLYRITNGELEGIDPKLTILMIGTNNINNAPIDTPEQAAAGVKKIVETVQEKLPKTKILLLAVFPRGNPNDAARKNAAAINPIIEKLADGKKVRWLDLTNTFLDAQGVLSRDIMPDLLHPNAKGYDLWADKMLPVVEEMMNEKD